MDNAPGGAGTPPAQSRSASTPGLPPEPEMWRAYRQRDRDYDGVFVAGIRTTGIFCRPGCPARTPRRENVTFFGTPAEAGAAGFRPCRRCRPDRPPAEDPEWLRAVLARVRDQPDKRLSDRDLRTMGHDPVRVRRYFQRRHGMTFHAWQRARRLGRAITRLGEGEPIVSTAYTAGFDSLSGFSDALRRLSDRSPDRARDARVVTVARLQTPLGALLAGATADGLSLLEFERGDAVREQLESIAGRMDALVVPGETGVTRQAAEEVEAYFARSITRFEVPLDLRGTEFQRAAWEALRAIPYGETISYGEQARRVGRPKAVRAVAQANGQNPVAIIVPCHRVIGADGSLTGYGAGVWRKRRLLELERGEIELPL